MNGRDAVRAAIEAARAGVEAPKIFQTGALNNLNLKNNNNLAGSDPGSLALNRVNLNNLKQRDEKKSTQAKRGGVPRLELYTDETWKKALAWGVEEWLLQVCIREYGAYTVKGQINRIHQIPDGYFKPQYGPIHQQRGRLFNKEMQKMKAARAC